MGNNFFQMIISAINRQFGGVIAKFRTVFNAQRVRGSIYSRLVMAITKLLDVRPKDKHDYYPVFGWLISKKLAYCIVLGLGVISAMFLWRFYGDSLMSKFAGSQRVYSYDSVFLKFAKGDVQIKAKQGYVAYAGQVEGGYAQGNGTLYGVSGNTLYTGVFAKSMYEGEGKSYFPSGALRYVGSFSQNLYNGNGSLYRENGSICYTGGFLQGKKEGSGDLYNNGSEKIYTGQFHLDYPLYSELLGKSASEVAMAYTGTRDVYTDPESTYIHMKEINVLCQMMSNENSINDDIAAEQVLVLSQEFPVSDTTVSVPKDLTRYLGKPSYAGTSAVTAAEALAMKLVREKWGDRYFSETDIETSDVYDDYISIESFDQDRLVYLYSYDVDGVSYTFVCQGVDKPFGFYYVTMEEDGGEI